MNEHRKVNKMNINKIVKDSVNGSKDKYHNTQLNPFKMPEKITVELVINYKESLKSLQNISEDDLKQCSKFFKLVRKQVVKELE